MLSMFEAALLDRHLRRCADCRAFAAGAVAQTQLLRDAGLEQPLHPVVVEAPRRRRPVRQAVAGAIPALAAVAAAAAVTLSPGGKQASSSELGFAPVQVGAPVLVVVPAHPSLAASETVPRLEMRPASIADGPVHGLFSTPISV